MINDFKPFYNESDSTSESGDFASCFGFAAILERELVEKGILP